MTQPPIMCGVTYHNRSTPSRWGTIAPNFADFIREKNMPFCEGNMPITKGAGNMKYDYRITGQVIGRLRTERGMSQELLSGLAGIERSHLGKIENGYKNASVDTLWRIADALGVKLSELIALVEQITPSD